jgi:very-short-patch-repair endonuclease
VPVKNIVTHQKVSKAKLARAKELRRNMTPAEAVLWREVRGNRLGVHFRRQQIISGYIVDFYCHEAGLVIELDGGVHKSADQAEADQLRDEALKKLGLRVVRLQNDDVVGDARSAVERIRSLLGG